MEPMKTTKTTSANGTADEAELCKAVAKMGLRTQKGLEILFLFCIFLINSTFFSSRKASDAQFVEL